MKKLIWISLAVLCFGLSATAQIQLPRESQGATVMQTIGDTRVTVVYHRPNVKGREVWGKLVPYGEVWRTGANENTIFEVSEEVMVNGQKLPAGKYGLHTIPNRDEWTVIFSKKNDEWGSFTYKPENDALRVKAKPQTSNSMREQMMFEFDNVTAKSADVVLTWEKLRLPFTVDVGDVNARVYGKLQKAVAEAKPDDFRPALGAAQYVLNNKMKDSYGQALTWTEQALKIRENFAGLNTRARLFAEMGNYKEAVAIGEKAVTVGKAATPPANAEAMANLEKEDRKSVV